MSGLPTVAVLLDDGTGTFPIDVTTQVREIDGIAVSGYGRADEQPTAQSATLALTFDNLDGSFSSGVGFGMGGFGSGFFGGRAPVAPGTKIRVALTSGATTVNRFTGRITSLELKWPTGGQTWSTVVVTAADLLADLARQAMLSLLEYEILALTPAAYYRLSEASGSTSAGDSSGNQGSPLVAAGTGAAVVFGSGAGPTDGLSTATFAGGQYLAPTTLATSTFKSFGCWFTRTGAPSNLQTIIATNNLLLEVRTDGRLQVDGASGVGPGGNPPSVVDGLNHLAVVTSDGFNVTLYVDGVQSGFGVALSNVPNRLYGIGGGHIAAGFGGSNDNFAGTVSHFFEVAGVLTAPQILSMYQVGVGSSETTAARATRIAGYVGTTCTTTTGSGQLVGVQSTSGVSVLDALQTVAAAEGGVFFADGSGALQLQGRGYRAQKATATLALPAEEPDPQTSIPWDTSQLVNSITVTRTGGAQQSYPPNPSTTASVIAYGLYPQTLDLIVADDTSALDRAAWIVNKHSTPAARIASLTVNPLAPAGVTAAQLLSLGIGDRVSLTLPSQQWAGSSDYIIEGWAETVSVDGWSITYNVLPFALFQAWILEDPVYGVLESTTIAG